MSERINLSQLPLYNSYTPCIHDTLQVKTHINVTLLGQDKLDLIHINIIGPFLPPFYEAEYVVIFLDDDTKGSEVCFLKQKSKVF